jgi:hypothetical protein
MLQVDNASLVDLPLRERWKQMSSPGSVLQFEPTYFELVDHEETEDFDRIMYRMEHLDPSEEGIVLKDPKSKYVPGVRHGGGWMKLKPEDLVGGTDSFDCLIVGLTKSGDFIVATADDDLKIFRTLCKVNCGLSREEYCTLCRYLRQHSKKFQAMAEKLTDTSRGLLPPGREWGYSVHWRNKEEEDGGGIQVYFSECAFAEMDVVFNPIHSVLVEITGDRRMIPSAKFMAGLPYPGCPVPTISCDEEATSDKKQKQDWGWTIRFPRIGPKGVRHGEKSWNQCMTQTELWEAIKKSNTLSSSSADGVSTRQQKRQLVQTTIQARKNKKTVRRSFLLGGGRATAACRPLASWSVQGQVDLRLFEVKWSTLQGFVVCIVNNFVDQDERVDLIRMAKEMGAKITMQATDATHIVASPSNEDQHFLNIKGRDINIIHPLWIRDCYESAVETDGEAGAVIPLQPCYMLHMSRATEERFQRDFDQYGDSYTVDATHKQMLIMLRDHPIPQTSGEAICSLDKEQVRAMEVEMMDEDEPPLAWSMFDGIKAVMFDPCEDEPLHHVSRLGLAAACLRAGGGERVFSPHEPTHVFVDYSGANSMSLEQVRTKASLLLNTSSTTKVVHCCSWIIDSFKEGRVLLDANGKIPGCYCLV